MIKLKTDHLSDEFSERFRKDYFMGNQTLNHSLLSLKRFLLYAGPGMKKLLIAVFLFLTFAFQAVAPDSNGFIVFESPAVNPYRDLMYAIGMVETEGNIMAYNDIENAVGIFQIRQVRIDDYNRRTGSNYALADMFDPELSEKVFLYFASKYKPYELEKIAKAWNGSGPRTEYYWKRIKEYL